MTSIGGCAFTRCTGLTSVTVERETPPDMSEYGVFGAYTLTNATLYVPAGCRAAYLASDYWKEFAQIIEMPVSITMLVHYSYGNCLPHYS